MPEWVTVLAAASLPEGGVIRVTVPDGDIALARVDGQVYAIDDTCSHGAVSLSEGDLVPGECRIECWLHGSEFDLRTGHPTCLPATVPLRTYPVRIDGDSVQVDLAVSE